MSVKAAVTAAALLAASPAIAAEAGPVYLIASLSVDNLDRYMAEYGMPVVPMLLEAGGEILVGTPEVATLDGDYAANWTVVVRFPSAESAQQWYESEAYQALVPIRHGLTDTEASTLILAPQFVMPPQP